MINIPVDSGTIMGAVNTLGLIYIIGWRFGRVDLKVNTMWNVYVEEAFISAKQKGMVVAQSPLQLDNSVRPMFGDLAKEIRRFADKEKLQQRTDSEAIWLLYVKFHEKLIVQVCLPHNMNLAQALVGALYIAKGESSAKTKSSSAA